MWWRIEYESWKPFEEDWEHHEEDADKWDVVWNRFRELVEDDNNGLVTVTTMWGNRIYTPDDPFVLVYNAK